MKICIRFKDELLHGCLYCLRMTGQMESSSMTAAHKRQPLISMIWFKWLKKWRRFSPADFLWQVNPRCCMMFCSNSFRFKFLTCSFVLKAMIHSKPHWLRTKTLIFTDLILTALIESLSDSTIEAYSWVLLVLLLESPLSLGFYPQFPKQMKQTSAEWKKTFSLLPKPHISISSSFRPFYP